MKSGRKLHVEQSCYDLTRERLAWIVDRFDHLAVSFSGGKDSTVCMNLTVEAARQAGRLPVDVFTFDEEAIPPETVEYLARVATRGDIRFYWYCVPIQHRNACSRDTPHWYPWAPEDKGRWVRPLPATALTDFPGFTRAGIAEQVGALFPPSRGTVANILGLRAQESLSRHRAIATKRGDRAYLTPGMAAHVMNVYPIYDWQTEDVWIAPAQFGWDYNQAYDVMDAAGIARHEQRCAPPFGEQPIRGLYKFKTCWPWLWQKMVDRVPGAATAARYANTELYATGVKDDDLPPGLTWRAWTMETLRRLPASSRQEAAYAIRKGLNDHRNRTGNAAMPDAAPDPVSGYCWKTLYLAAKVGGNKFGRIHQKINNEAIKERRRRGITH